MFKLSIIIPVFNAANYLPEMFRQLPSETGYQVILIDDGSTDNSLLLCREFAENRPGVIVLTQGNSGPGKARNIGLEHAEGEYITFLDADDGTEKNSFEAACEYLRENPVDLLIFQIKRRYLNGDFSFITEYSVPEILPHEELIRLWCRNAPRIKGYLWGKIYKKTLWAGIRIPEDMQFAEDMYILSDLFPRVKKFCLFPSGTYHYYERENTSVTGEWNGAKAQQLVTANLHRWECSVEKDFPLEDQIHAWNRAVILFFAEKRRFPGLDWSIIREKLKKHPYSFFSFLKSGSGIREKIIFLRNFILLPDI